MDRSDRRHLDGHSTRPPETDSRLRYYGHELAFWIVAAVVLAASLPVIAYYWLRGRRMDTGWRRVGP